MSEPSGIAIDTDGTFYVCNVTSLNIEKISASGAPQGSIASLPAGAMAADIALLAPGGQLEFSASSYSTSENAGTVTITVNRVNGSRGAASVAYSTTDGTARAPVDYPPTTGTLSWADGDLAPQSFTVSIVDKGINNGQSVSFMVALTNATGTGTLGMTASATVNISDNDPAPAGQIQFNPAAYPTFEDAGTVTITADRVGGSRGATSVTYGTSDGTAKAGTDYTQTGGTLSWADGDGVAKTFTVPILDRKITSGSVSFTVALTTINGTGTLGMTASATVNISDNDPAPAGQIQFNPAAYPTFEDAGTVTITANRVGGSRGATAVTYNTTDGTAKAGVDYTQTGGTLSWADGDATAKTFTVPLIDRKISGASVSFTVAFLTVNGTGTLGTPAAATVTITDNDAAAGGQIQLSAAAYPTFEDGGTVTITATRVGGSGGASAVTYNTTDGTAKAGVDYTQTGGTLSWADGDGAAKTFTVPLIDRKITGTSVSFTVTLLTVSGTGTLGSPGAATVTITDNDAAPAGQIQLSAAAYFPFEDAGMVTITANRVGGSRGATSVTYNTTDGTATAGVDYTQTGGTLSWADGEVVAKTFTVPLIDRKLTSGSVSFTVALLTVSGTGMLGSPASATVTIFDNDAPIQEPTATLQAPTGHLRVLRSTRNVLLGASVSDPSNQLSFGQFLVNGSPLVNVDLAIATTVEHGYYTGDFPVAEVGDLAPPAGDYQIQFQVTARDGTRSTTAAQTITLVDPIGTVTGGATATFLAAVDHVNVADSSTLTVDVMTTSAVDSTGATVSAVQRVDFYANGILFASRDGNGKTLPIPSRAPGRGPITRDALAAANTSLFEATYQVPGDGQPVTLQAVVTTSDGLNQLTAPLHVTPVAETGTPPVVTLGPLTGGLPIPAGASFVVPVTVSAPSVPVAMVQYYLNGALVSAATAPPYSVTVTPPVAGAYGLTAVVTDTNGVATFSAPLTFRAVPTVSVAAAGDGLAIVGGGKGQGHFHPHRGRSVRAAHRPLQARRHGQGRSQLHRCRQPGGHSGGSDQRQAQDQAARHHDRTADAQGDDQAPARA